VRVGLDPARPLSLEHVAGAVLSANQTHAPIWSCWSGATRASWTTAWGPQLVQTECRINHHVDVTRTNHDGAYDLTNSPLSAELASCLFRATNYLTHHVKAAS
jgi:hypothetical protein